jgi:hypothetical protein
MSENHPTRRDVLMSLAALPFLVSTPQAQAGASSVCFMSAAEIAGVKCDNYIDWMKSCWYR